MTQPHFNENGKVIFATSGSRTGVPACAASDPTRFAFDGTTAAGKNQVAAILTALALGRRVRVVGTGACAVHPTIETVQYVYIDE